MRVWVRLGPVPRMLTRSFSSKPPSVAPAELIVTPDTRFRESAMFLSGILPTSSEVITSSTESAARFCSSDFSREARIPVTTTSCSGAFCLELVWSPLVCACTTASGPNSATATAVPINVDLAILMIDPPRMLSLADAVSRRGPPPARPQGSLAFERPRGFPCWDHLHANIVPLVMKCYPHRYHSLLIAFCNINFNKLWFNLYLASN